MRISDWSSDVCFSDLADVLVDRQPMVGARVDHVGRARLGVARVVPARLHEGVEGVGLALGRAVALRAAGLAPLRVGLDRRLHPPGLRERSEERTVGKGWVRTSGFWGRRE